MFPLSKWQAVWLSGVAIIVLAASIALGARHSAPSGPVRVTEASASPSAAPVAASVTTPPPAARGASIYVHVSGQIARPGLYRLRPGARVMDAITGAGGATENSDLDALNLATPLQDGQKLVVPRFGDSPPGQDGGYLVDSPPPPAATLVRADPVPVEALPDAVYPPYLPSEGYSSTPPVASGWAGTPSSSAGSSSSGKLRTPGEGTVNINTAGLTELQRLPGVGPSTAQKILDYRRAHGGFRTVEELMEIKGIGEKKLAKMAPFVRL